MTNFTKNPDYLALLAGIVEHPDDDLRRLVFADWLEEHGDADRAEFIRLQVRKAQLAPADPERAAIDHRTGELAKTDGRRLLGELPREFARIQSEARRGFVYRMQVKAAQLLRLPKWFWRQHPIQHLYLTDLGGQLDRVLDNPHLAHVHTLFLVFRDDPPTQADLKALAGCPHLTGVRDLHLCGGGNALAAAVAVCPSLNGITYLDLYADINDSGMATLIASGERNLRGLKRLWVRNERYGSGTARALARSPALAGLEHLSIGFDGNRTQQIGDVGATALAASTHLGSLRTLRLHTQGIGPDGVRALTAARHWPHLRVLSLSGNRIGVDGARALAEPHGLRLEALDVSWCELGNDGIAALASSGGLTTLTALNLERNGIGAEGAVALARSRGLAGLMILNLEENEIGDAGALALCESTTLTNLRRLYALPESSRYSRGRHYSRAVETALKRRFTKQVFDGWPHTFFADEILGAVKKVVEAAAPTAGARKRRVPRVK